MTPRHALLLLAIAQTARARSATLAAIASNGDYANRLYGSSHAVDPSRLRVVWPDLMPPKLRKTLRVDCDGARTLFYERHFLQRRALYRFMIGAETTVIVLLLWVAAAGRAPAVGCRGGNIKISI